METTLFCLIVGRVLISFNGTTISHASAIGEDRTEGNIRNMHSFLSSLSFSFSFKKRSTRVVLFFDVLISFFYFIVVVVVLFSLFLPPFSRTRGR